MLLTIRLKDKERIIPTFSRMQTDQILACHNFLAASGIPQMRNLVVVSFYMTTWGITTAYSRTQNTVVSYCLQPTYPWHNYKLKRRNPIMLNPARTSLKNENTRFKHMQPRKHTHTHNLRNIC